MIVAATTALAVAAMLLVRRNAPEGSRFSDGDRASGVFGVLATGFSVLLGFIVMPQYRLAAEAEATRLDRSAEELAAVVRQDIQRASNYVLGVVLFAVALFAGMSTKLTAPGLRKTMLAVGFVLLLSTVIWIATFPVSVAV